MTSPSDSFSQLPSDGVAQAGVSRQNARRRGFSQGALRVVVVDEELPYPANSGKRIRTLNLLLRLARRHQITVICHRNADRAEAASAAEFFADQGVRTVVVDRPPLPKSGPGFYARLAANLLSPLPHSVAAHRSRALRQAMEDYAAANSVDLWHCEWSPLAFSCRGLSPCVVVAHNVETVIWERYREAEANPLKRWYIDHQCRKFARFERWAYREMTRTVAVSRLDAERIRRDFGGRHVDVVENGVDLDYFRPTAAAREPGRILFVGSLDWRPNLDAVNLLLDRVFPAVRAAEPTAQVDIVGRHAPESLRRHVRNLSNVELYTNVADVRPYLARSGVLAVPLRIAGGSRLKILEALAMALPVVSTEIGAEGLALERGKSLAVVPEPEDMAGPLLDCIRNPSEAQARAEAGRFEVLDRYDWEYLADDLEAAWMRCVAC
jgi:glycosyltransferase involved in cell wall biosynthesis